MKIVILDAASLGAAALADALSRGDAACLRHGRPIAVAMLALVQRQDRQHLVDRRTYRQRGSGELLRFKGRHHRSDKVRSERACGQRRDRQRRSSRLHRHRHDKRPLRQGKGEHAGSDPRKENRHSRGRSERSRVPLLGRGGIRYRRGNPRRRRSSDLRRKLWQEE